MTCFPQDDFPPYYRNEVFQYGRSVLPLRQKIGKSFQAINPVNEENSSDQKLGQSRSDEMKARSKMRSLNGENALEMVVNRKRLDFNS